MKKMNKKGFTIVELVIVIAVIGILAAVLIPTFSSVIDKANTNSALQAARNEYTLYVAENAETMTGDEELIIAVEENGTAKYYVTVTNGKLGEINEGAPTTEGYTEVPFGTNVEDNENVTIYKKTTVTPTT